MGITATVRMVPAALGAVAMLIQPAQAIPGFARKHNLRCTACHSVVPRLNEFGEVFLARGFRLPAGEQRAESLLRNLSAWVSGRYEESQGRPRKAFPNRVELIDGGPLGNGSGSYFVEWRILSLETRADGGLRDRSGRFEDLYATFDAGESGSFTVGQFRSVRQVDVSRRLSISEPLLLSASVRGDPSPDARITSLRAFAPAARSPGLAYMHRSLEGARPSDGLFHVVTLAVPGELSLPITPEAGREASFELETRLKGVFLETYLRRGLSSLGAHAFLDGDRHLVQGLASLNRGRILLTGGLGMDRRPGLTRRRYMLELETGPLGSPGARAAWGVRWEHVTRSGAGPAIIPYAAFSGPNGRGTILANVQYRAQSGADALFAELGAVF